MNLLKVKNHSLEKILREYNDSLDSFQDTFVNWEEGTITHYQTNLEKGVSPHLFKSFNVKDVRSMPPDILEKPDSLVKNPSWKAFLQNLTGLHDPYRLKDLGDYLQKRILITIPLYNNEYITSVRSDNNSITLSTNYSPGLILTQPVSTQEPK